jgi:hypothetical protein
MLNHSTSVTLTLVHLHQDEMRRQVRRSRGTKARERST